jgi:hypothetical protein
MVSHDFCNREAVVSASNSVTVVVKKHIRTGSTSFVTALKGSITAAIEAQCCCAYEVLYNVTVLAE